MVELDEGDHRRAMEPNKQLRYDWKGKRGETWREHLGPMEVMLRPIDAPLIDALGLRAACRVADIGCGGGGTSAAVFRRAPAGTEVHGVDISAGLVETARSLSSDPRLSFEVGDMENIDPPQAPYDRLISRFGVMFFQDPPQAFRRLRSWLVPGGRVAFAVWGAPMDNAWVSIVRDAVARVVELPSPLPDTPGPFRYAEPGSLQSLLTEAGFEGIETQEWRGELRVGGGVDAQRASDYALAAFSTFAERLDDAGPEKKVEAHAWLRHRLAEHELDGVVSLPGRAFIVTGSRGA